jgi:excisionase family DNA binding protein
MNDRPGGTLGGRGEAVPGPSDRPVQRVDALLVTLQEAGQMLGLSERSIYNLIDAGELRVVKMGRSSRVTVADVHAFIASRTVAPPMIAMPTRKLPAADEPRWYVPTGVLALKKSVLLRAHVPAGRKCDATYIASLPPKPPRKGPGMSAGPATTEVT